MSEPKKKKHKISTALIVIFILFVIGIGKTNNNTSANETAPMETETETAVTKETQPTMETESSIIEIVFNEQGEYGEWFTINKDTEFEENYYIYRVPVGTYIVTNTGKNMNQFNVYGDTVYITDSGTEELSDAYYVKVLNAGASDTVTIGDNQIIEIHGGSFTLEPIK